MLSGETPPPPNERHATLHQMLFGKAAGEDEVTAELLEFGGDNPWEVVVRVCRQQWLLLTEAVPGAEVVWPAEWCVGLVAPLWKRKGNNGVCSGTPSPYNLSEKYWRYTSNLYHSMPPICSAVPRWLLSFGERETPQYTSNLYCSTSPICTAVRLPFVPGILLRKYQKVGVPESS